MAGDEELRKFWFRVSLCSIYPQKFFWRCMIVEVKIAYDYCKCCTRTGKSVYDGSTDRLINDRDGGSMITSFTGAGRSARSAKIYVQDV